MRPFETIPSFAVEDSHKFFSNRKNVIKTEIESNDKQYILCCNAEEYIEYLVEKYSLDPLIIDFSQPKVQPPKVSRQTKKDHWGDAYQAEVYDIEVRYRYTGSPELFRVRPSHGLLASKDICVNERESFVSYTIRIPQQNAEEFQRQKMEYDKNGLANHENVNNDASRFNIELRSWATQTFDKLKEKYKKENSFFAAINVQVDKESSATFAIPVSRIRLFRKPNLPEEREFALSPTVSQQTYKSILYTIYQVGKSMEKKPSLYVHKDEEGLRDFFLVHLESHYTGLSATAETFNKGGKTDIIIKYEDGTNVFVAECKIWKGAIGFHAGITQLFERYLTWRDSKAAVIFFVPNKNFSTAFETAKEEIHKHHLFVKENGQTGETSLSYIFKLSAEDDKQVYLEVIFFHFDKL